MAKLFKHHKTSTMLSTTVRFSLSVPSAFLAAQTSAARLHFSPPSRLFDIANAVMNLGSHEWYMLSNLQLAWMIPFISQTQFERTLLSPFPEAKWSPSAASYSWPIFGLRNNSYDGYVTALHDGSEAKAKRTYQSKVTYLHLDMTLTSPTVALCDETCIASEPECRRLLVLSDLARLMGCCVVAVVGPNCNYDQIHFTVTDFQHRGFQKLVLWLVSHCHGGQY